MRQANLHRALRTCELIAFAPAEAHAVGALLARAGTSDVVAAHLVLIASLTSATIYTSDPADVRRLAAHVDGDVEVLAVT